MADKIPMTSMTGSGMHPKLKNLGHYAHPVKTGAYPDHKPKVKELKKALPEKHVPIPKTAIGVAKDYADFRPSPALGKNPRVKEKQVSKQLQNGGANANLASFNNASYDTTPFAPQSIPVVKSKGAKPKNKVSKGLPFYGNL